MPARGQRQFGIAWRSREVLLEAACILVVGMGFALLANALSPRGLSLTRDPFRLEANRAPATRGNRPSPEDRSSGIRPGGSAEPDLAARLAANGLTLVHSNEVARLFHDPRRDQELVVFVDARDEAKFAAGHIPGAYRLDPYRPERELPAVLTVCATAEQIVVYCEGSQCEDSELAAGLLRDAGVSASRLLVYAGGWSEWITNGLPVEVGARGSGPMRGAGP